MCRAKFCEDKKLHKALSKCRWLLLSIAICAVAGCGPNELVSERSFEEKAERLRVGQTSRADVEALLGTGNVVERNRLIYYFADVEFGVGVRRYAPPSGPLPINAGPFPSNTRGVITANFNDAGKLRHLVVERYFDPPFINDYSYAIKDSAKEPLGAIAKIAEAHGFKVADMKKENGTVTLQDSESKAQIAATLAGQILRLTSKNPHSRISTEYRLYSRRETNLTEAIASADWVQ